MEKILIAISVVAVAVIIGMVAIGISGQSANVSGSEKDQPWTSHGRDLVTKVVSIEGHKYVLVDGYRCTGIVHAESCDCKK